MGGLRGSPNWQNSGGRFRERKLTLAAVEVWSRVAAQAYVNRYTDEAASAAGGDAKEAR